jgi:hypothetical protein
MTPLKRFVTSASPLLLAGACAQIIGLSDYEKGGVGPGEGGEGHGNASSGGAMTKGGDGGAGDNGGGTAGVSTGGRSQGGTAGDGGTGGEPGDAGQGGTDPSGGTSGKGGRAGGGQGGTGGMPGGSSGSSGSGGSGAVGGSPPCIEITVSATFRDIVVDNSLSPHLVSYEFDIDPELGGAVGDLLEVQFWNGGSFNGVATGVFPLASGRDANNSTCARCILVHRDDGAAAGLEKTFFQTSGTLTVASASQQMDGYPTFSYADVTLREITIDPNDGHSTVVAGGLCVHVATAAFSRAPAWSCDPTYQDDGECDCGCTTPDPDCPDGNASSCQWCWCDQAGNECPGFENPTQNWTCL